MTEVHELRTFVCKYCGHEVVVKPDLPADYTPNVCTPCYEAQGLARKDAEFKRELFGKMNELFKVFGMDPL